MNNKTIITLTALFACAHIVSQDPFANMFEDMHEFMREQAAFMQEQSKRMDELFKKEFTHSPHITNQLSVETTDNKVIITIHGVEQDEATHKTIKVTTIDSSNLEGSIPVKHGALELAVRNGKSLIVSSSSQHEQGAKDGEQKTSFYSSSSFKSHTDLPAIVENVDKSEITFDKTSQKLTIAMPKAASGSKQLSITEVSSPTVNK